MKAFVSFVIVLILVAGGLVGYLFWERMNRIEPRGAGLVMNSPIPDEELELAEKQEGDEAPGTVLATDDSGIFVRCGDGTVAIITELQREGRRRMPADAFLIGERVVKGELFG